MLKLNTLMPEMRKGNLMWHREIDREQNHLPKCPSFQKRGSFVWMVGLFNITPQTRIHITFDFSHKHYVHNIFAIDLFESPIYNNIHAILVTVCLYRIYLLETKRKETQSLILNIFHFANSQNYSNDPTSGGCQLNTFQKQSNKWEIWVTLCDVHNLVHLLLFCVTCFQPCNLLINRFA